MSYGLVAWGQAVNTHLNKIVTLQKRVLRLMYFSDYKAHSAPLFVNSGILLIKLLYFKSVASLLRDIREMPFQIFTPVLEKENNCWFVLDIFI